ncbi:XRE family transcriptional regulator [Tenacibaculum sp. 190524A02b]|uniref:XRE family transcriptional regulator n=1 Tax=Tenacibaculum vairaonense TaxID=3137860 RepID=A0ABP1FCW8_9FLAO
MSELSEKLKNLNETTYQSIAKEFGVSTEYVGMIARGEREPKRGKGLKIKEALEQLERLIENSNINA